MLVIGQAAKKAAASITNYVSTRLPAGHDVPVCGIDTEWFAEAIQKAIHDQELAAVTAVTAERDKLQRFKEYVHRRLDEAGVPTDPDSPHRAEGCRIGGRLDIVLADRNRFHVLGDTP
jgi:hypothetical protein